MVSQEEFSVLDSYKDVLVQFSEGRSTVVTRGMWADLQPIAFKHLSFSGTINCGYCCSQLLKYCFRLYSEARPSYEVQVQPVKKVTRGRKSSK